jgi:hypothetical protein
METCSRSKSNPTRPIGSKLKKKHLAAKDAAHVVAPDSSGVKERHDTTAVAVPAGMGGKKNDNKIQKKPVAVAVCSSGKETVEKPVAIGVAVSNPSMNEATTGTTKTLEKPNAIVVAVSNPSVNKATTGTTKTLEKPDTIVVAVSDPSLNEASIINSGISGNDSGTTIITTAVKGPSITIVAAATTASLTAPSDTHKPDDVSTSDTSMPYAISTSDTTKINLTIGTTAPSDTTEHDAIISDTTKPDGVTTVSTKLDAIGVAVPLFPTAIKDFVEFCIYI